MINVKSYIGKLFGKNQNSSNFLDIVKEKVIDNTENEKVPGTPFFIIKNNEDNTSWMLVFGTYKIKVAKTKKELKDYLITDRFNIMCDMMIIIAEMKEKNQNLNK